MFEFDKTMGRLRTYFGVKTNTELSKKLNIDYNTIKGWGSRKKVAIATILESLQGEPINITWLVTGKGEMRIGDSDEILDALGKIQGALEGTLDPKIVSLIGEDNKIQELVSLLPYATDKFTEQVIERLKEFKKLSEI